MKVIYKYAIQLAPMQGVVMPRGAEILDVQVQRGEMQIWALVVDKRDQVQRRVYVHGTGCQIDPELADIIVKKNHIGTVQMSGYAWHVFMEPE